VNRIKDGLGDKLGSALQFATTFLIGVLISLITGWKLTLVVLAISPLLFFSTTIFTKVS